MALRDATLPLARLKDRVGDLRFDTEAAEVIRSRFALSAWRIATVTSSGEPIALQSNALNDCKKAKSVLGATILAVVERSIELGVIEPPLYTPRSAPVAAPNRRLCRPANRRCAARFLLVDHLES